jgi:DNA polymerase
MKIDELKTLNKRILTENSDKEIVLGSGDVNSKIVLIGEAPGAKEVEFKKPFVGQAGKYLEEFLNILQLNREDIYITNTVKFRPTRKSSKTGKDINRAPTSKEIERFKQYLFDEIQIIDPNIIVTLGNVPLKAVIENKNLQISSIHGQLIKGMINDKQYNIFPLYHPAAVIYRKELKEVYLNDLNKLKTVLNDK